MNLGKAWMESTNSNRVALVRDTIKSHINNYFSGSLAREADIVNIVNALVLQESGFNSNAIGPIVSYGPRTNGAAYFNCSAISSKYHDPATTFEQRSNIFQGLSGMGLMQVMGWNLVKGGAPSGKCEIERLRPDISGTLVVLPGESIIDRILGPSNISKAILAGLIMLEGKYRAAKMLGSYFVVPGDPYNRKFTSKIQAAVSSYLGLGRSDILGTTPEAYSNQIIGGSVYARANGKGSLSIRDSEIKVASRNGPGTNGSNMATVSIAGCSA